MGDQHKQGGQDRNQGRQDQRNQQGQQGDQSRMGNKPGMQKPGQRQDDLVGKDTDGDGKTVQPGQRPGQSHGTGHMDKNK